MIDPQLYKLVFQGRQDGKEVFDDLNKIFYNRQSFVRDEPYLTAFNEGQRSVIAFIQNKLNQEMET